MTQAALILNLPTSCIVNSTHDQPIDDTSKIQNWCGRGISSVRNAGSMIGSNLLNVTQKAFVGLNFITADSSATAGVFRKLNQYVLNFFEHLSGARGSLSKFSTFIGHQVAFIDFVQLASDINYFVCGKFREEKDSNGEIVKPRDHGIVVGGRVAFFTAGIGGALLWLQDISFISLSKAAAAIGEARIFSFVPSVISSVPILRDLPKLQNFAKAVGEFRVFSFIKNFRCLSVTLRALDLGYTLFAVEATRRLITASNQAQAISAGIDLSSYLSELVLSALVFAGVTNVVGLGVVGATCIALTVSSFLYRITHNNEIKQKIQLTVQQ